MTTWRKAILRAMEAQGETWDDLESQTLTTHELDREFDDGYGSRRGRPFTLWTHKRVYFPVVYDGAEWVGSAPRHPCGEPTPHQGGGQQ